MRPRGRYRNPPLHTKNQVRHHKQKNHTKGSYWSCITIAIFPYYTQLPLCAYVVPYSLQNASLGSSLSFQRAFWPSSGVRHPCPNRRHCDRQWKRQSSWNASSLCEAEFDPHRPQHDQMNQKVFILRKVLPFPLLSLPVDCFNGFQKLAAFLHESEDESPFWYLTNEVRCTQLGNPRSSPNNQFPSYKGPKHEITKKNEIFLSSSTTHPQLRNPPPVPRHSPIHAYTLPKPGDGVNAQQTHSFVGAWAALEKGTVTGTMGKKHSGLFMQFCSSFTDGNPFCDSLKNKKNIKELPWLLTFGCSSEAFYNWL